MSGIYDLIKFLEISIESQEIKFLATTIKSMCLGLQLLISYNVFGSYNLLVIILLFVLRCIKVKAIKAEGVVN